MSMSDGNDQGSNDSANNQNWPTSVDEAVDRLLRETSEQDKATLRGMAKDGLIMLHLGWGMGIRNTFGLWGGNEALMESCAKVSGLAFMHPDDASMVIIEAVWERLHGER